MELTDSEIVKKIIKIEKLPNGRWCGSSDVRHPFSSNYCLTNPLTDKALNCELRDKHEVNVNYQTKTVFILNKDSHVMEFYIDFNSKEEIPRAVLRCIIEAKANDQRN